MKKVKGQKKIYSKPELEVVTVDHEISLVMMSPYNPNEDPVAPTAVESSPLSESSSPASSYESSSENNPFGGSEVEY